MCLFQIYLNATNRIFCVPLRVFTQFRYLSLMHEFQFQSPVKYPRRNKLNRNQLENVLQERDRLHRNDHATRTVDRKTYYNILGVDKNASLQDIKKAYYILARKFHPDSSKIYTSPESDKKFQEIAEAYSILTDANKRREYDMYGIVKSVRKTLPTTKVKEESEQKLSRILDAAGYKRQSDSFDPPHSIKVPDDNLLKLTFLESVRGATKALKIKTLKRCQGCSAPNDLSFKKNLVVCDKCSGSGLQPVTTATGNIVRGLCKLCRGRRYVPQHICSECGGRGISIINQEIQVTVPPGVESGDILKIPHPNKSQQISVKLLVAKHDHFSRVGNDIHSELPITISQAVLGGVIKARGAHDDHKIVLEPGTETGAQIRLIGKGIKTNSSTGDHILSVRIRIPKMLTTKQKALMTAFAEMEAEGPDRKAELRRSKIKDELATLHNLVQSNPPKTQPTQSFSNNKTLKKLLESKSYSYKVL